MTQPQQQITQGSLDAGSPETIHDLIKGHAERSPNAVAIAAPSRQPLTYRRLCTQVEDAVCALQSLGVRRRDRVAMVLPNGPEMAVAFLAVSSGATCAPLNPAYGSGEFEFYLSDLNPKALLVGSDMESPARAVAIAQGIPILELSPALKAEAGIFGLEGSDRPGKIAGDTAQPEDVALVLYTSGTTSRPKLVPLTHANLCTSAIYMRDTYELDENDRCLNIMPLFHIHGLAVALLAPLAAGGSVVCTPSFDTSHFFGWLDACSPTWYSAVPTMHLAILNEAGTNRGIIARHPLRFICSQSATLPVPVMVKLEEAFGAPVIESYGLTETSSHVASNRLTLHERRAGSVGKAAGPQVSIMDGSGNLLAAVEAGEIVVRGKNVFQGYHCNPEANRSSFTSGWFRTGDQGYLDENGHLYITGRIKEIINRGGEKIAPKEIDDVLLDHPAVSQAVTFAVPHPTLGEYVAAAVILKRGNSTTEQQLREWAISRLAAYKVPSQVLLVDQIPTSATGKVQRGKLAEELAPGLMPPFVAPRQRLEADLTGIWAELLGHEKIGVHDNFFALGGDSLLGMRLLARINEEFGTSLSSATLFEASTIEELAHILGKAEQRETGIRSSLVPMQSEGARPPLFVVPGNLGNVFVDLGHLVPYLGPDQPFYGLQDWRQNPVRIEALATRYLDEIRGVQPEGPYLLVGVCAGAIIVFEMAQQLQARGQEVPLLAMVEPPPSWGTGLPAYVRFSASILRQFQRRFGYYASSVAQLGTARLGEYLQLKIKVVANDWALLRYAPRPFPGHMHLFLAKDSLSSSDNPQLRWPGFALGGAMIHHIPGGRGSITGVDGTPIDEAQMKVLAERLEVCIQTELDTSKAVKT